MHLGTLDLSPLLPGTELDEVPSGTLLFLHI